MQTRRSRYDDAIAALDLAVVLFALQEVGAFAGLLAAPLTAIELAARTSTDASALETFLDLAVGTGFLTRDGDRYGLLPGDAAIFDPSDPTLNPLSAPPLLEWLPRRARFAEVLRSGEPVPSRVSWMTNGGLSSL